MADTIKVYKHCSASQGAGKCLPFGHVLDRHDLRRVGRVPDERGADGNAWFLEQPPDPAVGVHGADGLAVRRLDDLQVDLDVVEHGLRGFRLEVHVVSGNLA